MKPLEDCQLYTFIDAAYLQGREPERVAQELCDGGSDLIQLRAKGSSEGEVQRLAERVAPIVKAAGVGLVINDFPDVAARVEADLVHLGQEDFLASGCATVGELRQRMMTAGDPAHSLRVGLSTHAPLQARAALEAGADYIAIGPVFPTGTKPAARPVTLQYVRWAAEHVTVPWFAIGGITLSNLESVLAAGARRVCAVSAILMAPDVARACQQFKERLLSAGHGHTR